MPTPDEARAAEILRRECGQGLSDLSYAEVSIGVDFAADRAGRTVAIEVARFTDAGLRRDWSAASKLLGTERTLITAKSWLVSFDGHPRYKGIEHRLGPALWTLERYNLDRYHAPLMDWWMEDVEELAAAVRNMRTEAVITAEVFPTREPYPNGRLFIAPTGGWVYGGPDSSLAVLESYLAEEAHHMAKTSCVHADERHLFVWIDEATPGECSRASSDDWGGSLPLRPPALPEGLEHLWVVHESTGNGWHWQRPGQSGVTGCEDGWSAVRDSVVEVE